MSGEILNQRSPANNISVISDDDDFEERVPPFRDLVCNQIRSACSIKLLKRRIPILNWAPKYQPKFLLEDCVAGITVGLTAIPQGIAYAVVAGLEPQYGLYSGFMGCFIYIIFGHCKAITIGPTAIMALMTQPYITGKSPDFAVLLAFISGVMTLLFGILNLGFLVQFISSSVISGFTTAAAITIASGQIKSLFGLPGKGTEFLKAWENFFKNVSHTRPWDTLLGIVCIGILLTLKRIGQHRGSYRALAKYLSLSRNALVVFIGTLMAYIFSLYGMQPFLLTGNIGKGLPPFKLPPFTTVVNNQTVYFSDMITELGSSVISIPLISILETVTIATIFCEKGSAVDATQEMIAVGLCNIFSSFFSAMPTTGSFTRSAVNHTSGVRSPLSGAFTGALVLLALGLLTSTFYFIPKAVLAAVIISAMFPMMEFKEIYKTFKIKRLDVIPLIVTLITCLLIGLEEGILIGVATNFILLLYSTSRPSISMENFTVENSKLLVVTPNQSLIFSSADFFRYKIIKYALEHDEAEYVIINGRFIQNIDITAMKKISGLIDNLKQQGKKVVFWNWENYNALSLVLPFESVDFKFHSLI
uniref:CSON009900 protein n=1 Tax=Culicoides sonorensis TaxID=179676 RepID=A0A336KGN5_CULSO